MEQSNQKLEFKKQKALMIAQAIIAAATEISSLASQLGIPQKKIFRKDKFNRRPMWKRKRATAAARMAITAGVAQAQLQIIMGTPMPKFPQGTYELRGQIIGETGQEIFESGEQFEKRKLIAPIFTFPKKN